MEVAPPQKLLTVLLLLFLFTLAYAYINWWLQHFGNIAILLYRLRSKKRDRGYGVEAPKDCYDYWSTYGAKTFKLIIILPTQCNALIRLCLPPSQKRVKLFYIVFPLPHGGITVCTRQYPYPTTYLLDTFQSVLCYLSAWERVCGAVSASFSRFSLK